MPRYSNRFYDKHEETWRSAASVLIPMVTELTHPRSVLDVGCGTGSWLAACLECGAEEVVGVDGSYVDRGRLKIAAECFRAHDLREPLDLGRRFDLVISLEVAEHLPGEVAESFVENLVRHGDVVMFSAAIPFQGGEGHVNEQWPEYWAKLFAKKGYVAIDCLRWKTWNDPRVRWWYSQNVILYATPTVVESNPALQWEYERALPGPLPVAHPQKYLRHADPSRQRLGRVLRTLVGVAANPLRRRSNERQL